jgi:ABC-type amino acid transport substrate-binding protein
MTMMRTFLYLILACVISSFITVKYFSPQGGAAIEKPKETAFERIQRTRTLRCGYIVIDPSLLKDPNTHKFSGPAFDIVEALGKNLKFKVEWIAEAGFASIGEDLRIGRYDMLCTPIGANAERGQVMNVSRKVFFMPAYLYVQKGETRSLMDLSWVNNPDVTLSAIDGTVFNNLIARFYPRAKLLSLPELTPISDQLLQVSTGKADATVMMLYNADRFMQANPDTVKRGSDQPLTTFSHQFWLPHGDAKMKNMIDVALDEMHYNGSINDILSKHETTPSQYYWRVAPEYAVPAESAL